MSLMAAVTKWEYAILSQANPANFWTGPDGNRTELFDDWFTILNRAGANGWELVAPLPRERSDMNWSTKRSWLTLLLRRPAS
jgi:hypothetical protein